MDKCSKYGMLTVKLHMQRKCIIHQSSLFSCLISILDFKLPNVLNMKVLIMWIVCTLDERLWKDE